MEHHRFYDCADAAGSPAPGEFTRGKHIITRFNISLVYPSFLRRITNLCRRTFLMNRHIIILILFFRDFLRAFLSYSVQRNKNTFPRIDPVYYSRNYLQVEL